VNELLLQSGTVNIDSAVSFQLWINSRERTFASVRASECWLGCQLWI